MSEGLNKNIFKFGVNGPQTTITSWTGFLRYDLILKAEEANVREEECSICLEALVSSGKTAVYLKHCLHSFHLSCLKIVYEINDKILKCPLCRFFYKLPGMHRTEYLNSHWRQFGTLYVYIYEESVRLESIMFAIFLNIINMDRNEATMEIVRRVIKAWKIGKLNSKNYFDVLMKCDLQSIKAKLDEWNIHSNDFVDELVDDNDMYDDGVDRDKNSLFGHQSLLEWARSGPGVPRLERVHRDGTHPPLVKNLWINNLRSKISKHEPSMLVTHVTLPHGYEELLNKCNR
ncbi:hypothetical protein HELRODRAFT_176707 [Helobdella robusta]|uniref:E3 ubiquitin-protein ligase n=1 Tax=Helobdella robusta TaxID=6412 RepID=T1FAT1_HELRO|nr:hypothetical protein HELRODRAFT_176707 [Helobdella robusta]ESN99540.1 hypothetical protein HELRODRAFT_176707 [Helobdella robusta]